MVAKAVTEKKSQMMVTSSHRPVFNRVGCMGRSMHIWKLQPLCRISVFFFTVKLQLPNEFVSHIIITAKKLIHAHTDLPPNSMVRNWKNLTFREWKVFVACQINMGQHIQPTVESDWYTNPPQYCPRFQNLFPRDHFPVILTFFHLLESGNVFVCGELG